MRLESPPDWRRPSAYSLFLRQPVAKALVSQAIEQPFRVARRKPVVWGKKRESASRRSGYMNRFLSGRYQPGLSDSHDCRAGGLSAEYFDKSSPRHPSSIVRPYPQSELCRKTGKLDNGPGACWCSPPGEAFVCHRGGEYSIISAFSRERDGAECASCK